MTRTRLSPDHGEPEISTARLTSPGSLEQKTPAGSSKEEGASRNSPRRRQQRLAPVMVSSETENPAGSKES
eukprot:3786543-Heterocapsa_arctica.AAC.2